MSGATEAPRTPRDVVRDIVKALPFPRPGRDGPGTLSHAQRHLLGVLLDAADDELRQGCRLYVKEIAEAAGYDGRKRKRVVRRHLRALEDKGWVRRIPTLTQAGDYGPNVIALMVPREVVEELGGPAAAVRVGIDAGGGPMSAAEAER